MTQTYNIKVQGTEVFKRNYEDNESAIIVNRGGSGSSKSYSIMQKYILRLLYGRGRKLLIVRKTLPSVRVSVLPLFHEITDKLGVRGYIREEKQNLNYFYRDNLLHFGSVDDPAKLKSSSWSDMWMEEATEFTYDDFMTLRLYLREQCKDGWRNQFSLSFNPIDEFHWIKLKLISLMQGVNEIHSTYRMNLQFLNPEFVKVLEELQAQDPNYHRIYGLGEWGKLDSLIYPGFNIVPELEVGEVIYGLDFGFNNPSSLVQCNIMDDRRTIFIHELLYQTNLTNRDLIAKMSRLIPDKSCPLYADSAEPDRIQEIFEAGYNVFPAKKDVLPGIDFVKNMKLNITSSSDNLIKEFRGYSWIKDKNGAILDKPIKFRDHGMDAVRYALYTYLGETGDLQILYV